MKSKFLLLAVAGLAVAFLGCGSGSNDAETAADKATEAAESAVDAAEHAADQATEHAQEAAEMAQGMAVNAVTMEVGCGMCTYHMDGVNSCTAAVKMGDKTMLLTGGGVDAHALGLCAEAKQATVTGEIVDGKLVAKNVEFQ